MIVAAGLLVLAGLGLFVGGFLTGATAFYWACVAVCVAAAVLLYLARRGISRAEAAAGSPPRTTGSSLGTTPSAVPSAAGATASAAAAPVAPEPGEPPATGDAPEAAPATEPPAPREPAHVAPPSTGTDQLGDPPIEDVEVTDLLLVVDCKDEVLVVDEHPRYHLAGCPHLRGRTTIPLPLDEARTDGFTPCAVCSPDRNLAERERARKHARGS